MPDLDRITAILGFQRYQVTEVKGVRRKWIQLTVDASARTWRCPRCKVRVLIYYDRRWVKLRDLDWAKHRTVLLVPKYRVPCKRCGVIQVPIGIARVRARCTKRFEKWLFVLTRTMPLTEVAKITEVGWTTVRDAEIRYILGMLRKRDLDGIQDLGIDEVSEKSGHRYLTLVTDIRRRRVIWVGKGRDRKALKRFFRWFGPKRTRRLKRFVIDMHDPYEQEIRATCPRAKIVFDHFHLAKILHQALDDLRRRLQRELPPEGRRFLKGQRYLLLKAQESLTAKQKVRLEELLSVNEPLSTAYILKEDFRTIFSEMGESAAVNALREWKERVRCSSIPELTRFLGTLARHRYGIQNYFRHRITNGLSEGFNNVVKTIKKVAYGFHDSHYFGLKILRQCGRLEGEDPWSPIDPHEI
jgi:transposase